MRLEDVTLNIVDGVHGDCTPDEDSGFFFISVKDMMDFRIDYSNARQIKKLDYIEANKRTKLENNDVLFANTGDTIGKMLRITPSTAKIGKTTFQKSIAILKPDKKKIDPLYFYYLIRYNIPGLRKTAVGSGQDNLLLVDMRDYNVHIPHNEKEQGKIAELLSLLDRKIEINDKINNNLQNQLRIKYDYWFTQFDFPDEQGKPYRSSGGKMVWNEELKKEIPENWTCVSLGELLVNKSEEFKSADNVPTIDLSVMPSSSISLEHLNTSDMFTTNLNTMHKGDILFGSIRPYLKKAGIAPCDGAVAGSVYAYNVRKNADYNFALCTMIHDSFFAYALSMSTGTRMPVVSSESLMEYKVAYSENISNDFNSFEIQNTICNNNQETQVLTSIRDWLLSAFMNGQAVID